MTRPEFTGDGDSATAVRALLVASLWIAALVGLALLGFWVLLPGGK